MTSSDESIDVGILGAMAAWRLSKGIYRFDHDLFDAVWNTPLNHELPVDLFFRLPEYCVYIETPEKLIFGKDLRGFFAHLEDDMNDRHVELRLLLDLDDSPLPVQIHLDQEGIKKSVEKAQRYGLTQFEKIYGIKPGLSNEVISNQTEAITPLVSLVLYICSTNAELISKDGQLIPNRAKPKKIKKGKKFFPAEKETGWDVGIRTGAAIRASKKLVEYSQAKPGEDQKRKSPVTHPRRAHWQTFWTGKGKTTPAVKWVNMTIVNPAEKIQPTLHKVEK